MAYTSAAQGLGFVIGPGAFPLQYLLTVCAMYHSMKCLTRTLVALAAALSQVNFRVGAVVVNQYTAAGYMQRTKARC